MTCGSCRPVLWRRPWTEGSPARLQPDLAEDRNARVIRFNYETDFGVGGRVYSHRGLVIVARRLLDNIAWTESEVVAQEAVQPENIWPFSSPKDTHPLAFTKMVRLPCTDEFQCSQVKLTANLIPGSDSCPLQA